MGATYKPTSMSVKSNDIRKLSSLLQISQALSATASMKSGLQDVLEILARDHGAFRSIVALADSETSELQVEAAHGANRPSHQIRYGIGEGIVGRVVETGKPVVIPKVTDEPTMLHQASARRDACSSKKGRFELAEGGTLFLDEIGDVHPATQVKLLRVLQEREFERLGGTTTVKVNVRLIAATHKDMEQAIAQGTFREDLYYRLNVFPIFVPPLRERKADVLLLTDHFLERFAREHRREIRRLSTPAIDMLTAYHWPGNVRELQNVIERAVLVCDGQVIHAHHLPPSLQTAESTGTVMSQSLEDAVSAYEADVIKDALKSARGNRAKAARLLRTTDRIFNYRIRKLKIDWKRFA